MRRQLRFFGHVLRRYGMEHLVVTGKIQGTRGRGRQRETILTNIKRWLGMEDGNGNRVVHVAMDRDRWREMTVNVTR